MDFSDISINQILNAKFNLYKTNPVIKPFDSFVVADPSLLTPDESPDGKWHIFFHTNVALYHFVSPDGVNFTKKCRIVWNAMRPDINRIDGTYYLFFEKTRSFVTNALNLVGLTKWQSEIYVMKSKDLEKWSEPKPVLTFSKEFEMAGKGYSLSNPFLVRENGFNRLYYSCGLTFIKDCGFSEPTYINYAESNNVDNGYKAADEPIIKPNKDDPYLNLCSGCLKVYKMADGYIGIQNGIYEKDGQSHSAIMLLTSPDGLSFEFSKILVEPGMYESANWMKQFVYASHLVRYNNEIRLYFNGRDTSNMIKGRECIGFVEAKI